MLADVVEATWEHIEPISANMREADTLEVWLSSHKTPHQAMSEGFQRSVKAWTIMHDDVPIGMFGVSCLTLLGHVGVPWLLGTNEMLKIKRQFVRESNRYIDEMLSMYPNLINYVHTENRASIRWLKWLGFSFEGPVAAGPEGAPFYRFERKAHV